MYKNLKGNLILLVAAIIWGLAFVAQDKAADTVQPFAINAIRSYIGFLFLLPVCAFVAHKRKERLIPETVSGKKNLLLAGLICGIMLTISANLQQFGISSYPDSAAASARSGFITAMYVVLVPIFGLFIRKKTSLNVWLAVLLSVAGLYLLCLSEGLGKIYTGDIVVLGCAVAFSFHIMCVDHFASSVDGVKLSCLQFFVCGTLSSVLMFIFEKPTLSGILAAMPYLLFIGIMSSGVAYTLQIIGQQYSKNPTVASIIMSLESVFAALGGLFVGETLSAREAVGCAVMFAAIVLSQIKFSFRKKEVSL